MSTTASSGARDLVGEVVEHQLVHDEITERLAIREAPGKIGNRLRAADHDRGILGVAATVTRARVGHFAPVAVGKRDQVLVLIEALRKHAGRGFPERAVCRDSRRERNALRKVPVRSP